MRFVEAWASLPPLDVFRLFVPAAVLSLACVLPGRPIARATAITFAIASLLMPEIGEPPIRLGWAVLWGVVAAAAGGSALAEGGPRTGKRGAVEAGAVGMLLGLGLLVILVVAIAGQGLPPQRTRQASYGVFLMGTGLVHLMLGRDVVRGAVSFAAIGLGLHWLERAAGDAVLAEDEPFGVMAFAATAAVVVLCMRIVAVRRLAGGTPSVSHAHDLHD
jgi:hypothetical protein